MNDDNDQYDASQRAAWRDEAIETAYYETQRRERAARRARRDRERDDTGEISDDDWVVEDRSQLTRLASPPETLGEVLGRLVGDRRWGERLRGVDLFTVWPEVVGADLAQHVRPVRLAGGILVVSATSSAWATQVTYLADDLVRRCNDALGETLVTKVDVKVD